MSHTISCSSDSQRVYHALHETDKYFSVINVSYSDEDLR